MGVFAGRSYESIERSPKHKNRIKRIAKERWFQVMWNSNHRPFSRLAAQTVIAAAVLELKSENSFMGDK